MAHIRVHHTDHERAETQQTIVPDEVCISYNGLSTLSFKPNLHIKGEMAIESLLAEGEEYVVTLEEGAEEEDVLMEDGQEQTVEIIVPEAHVECEVANVS